MFGTSELKEDVIDWIRNWFADKLPMSKALIGISGGKDSLVCAALLREALGQERVIGVMMPNGTQSDIEDSKRIVQLLGIGSVEVNIAGAYESLTSEIKKWTPHLTSQYSTNLPARLRMVTLYGLANNLGGFVANTCNLSETLVGWETYGGDGFGDFSPLGKLTVQEVVAIGTIMGLPKELVQKTPSDGMCGSSDEEKFGFTYEELDNTIRHGVEGPHFEQIMEMYRRSRFKRENLHIPTFDPYLPVLGKFNVKID